LISKGRCRQVELEKSIQRAALVSGNPGRRDWLEK